MSKDPIFIPTGEIADDEIRVYPSDRVEIRGVDAQRLLIQIHYYPNENAFLSKSPELMNFMFTSHGAEVMANHILKAIRTMKEDEVKQKPLDRFRKN